MRVKSGKRKGSPSSKPLRLPWYYTYNFRAKEKKKKESITRFVRSVNGVRKWGKRRKKER